LFDGTLKVKAPRKEKKTPARKKRGGAGTGIGDRSGLKEDEIQVAKRDSGKRERRGIQEDLGDKRRETRGHGLAIIAYV